MGKAGRPSLYTPELAQEICDRVAEGESMRSICACEGMPDRQTVLRWLERHPEFAAKHARAREAQADVMDERIMDEAEAATPEMANVARLRIDAFKWRAGRLAPKKYGDKLHLAGHDGGSVKTEIETRVAPDTLRELTEALLSRADEKK